MKKYILFVEGKADAVFLKDFLHFHKDDFDIIKDKNTVKELQNSDIFIKIIVLGGYSAIKKHLRTKFEEIRDQNYSILVFQDADDPVKDPKYGGKELRINYLENIKDELSIKFDVFLFPNHNDDGDLESLLLRIVNKDHFDKSHQCYKDYADSLSDISSQEHLDELFEDKNVVFTYFRTYEGMHLAKEENRNYKTHLWDLNSKEIEALKMFLKKIIE